MAVPAGVNCSGGFRAFPDLPRALAKIAGFAKPRVSVIGMLPRYTDLVAMTTIKVDVAVRDRLARVAKASGVTMASLLRDVTTELEARMNWAIIDGSYRRLREESPDEWAAYMAELDGWDSVTGDPGNAAEEWPEFNT